jgi:hypothetical protein
MPLLALDFLACVVTRRIDAGPPCMGPFLSSGFRAGHIVLIGFFVRPGVPFLRPDPQYCKPTRAGAVKVGRRPNLAAYSALARPYLDSFEHNGTLSAVGMTIRGEPAFLGADQIAPRPCIRWSRTRTMMHSCASAAKLRGGGPILFPGMKAKGGDRDPATSNRHRHPLALEATGRSCRKISM